MVPRKETVLLVATASDDTGVAWVRFLVQGQEHCAVTQPPYQCPWQVPNAANKTYTLQATAGDAAGHTGASLVVRVTAR